jgi:hypothetical protein
VDESEAPPVPASVFADLKEHPDLVEKWVEDRGFREQVVRAEDPARAVEELMHISLHDDTKGWINERVEARTPDGLLEPQRPIPF